MHVHIVQKGDTLWKISRQYGVPFEEVKRLNAHLANPDYIVPGMKIFLPDHVKKGKGEKPMEHPYKDGKPKKPTRVPPASESSGLKPVPPPPAKHPAPPKKETKPAPPPAMKPPVPPKLPEMPAVPPAAEKPLPPPPPPAPPAPPPAPPAPPAPPVQECPTESPEKPMPMPMPQQPCACSMMPVMPMNCCWMPVWDMECQPGHWNMAMPYMQMPMQQMPIQQMPQYPMYDYPAQQMPQYPVQPMPAYPESPEQTPPAAPPSAPPIAGQGQRMESSSFPGSPYPKTGWTIMESTSCESSLMHYPERLAGAGEMPMQHGPAESTCGCGGDQVQVPHAVQSAAWPYWPSAYPSMGAHPYSGGWPACHGCGMPYQHGWNACHMCGTPYHGGY
ncbi:LysM peptidoglycan-binding domain-containing protein [Bhargavaea ullalensis]|uniref:Morphogenetic protein associated with SpoVID n=1 Tax=Bhargavaea ullalensis TaxID=1265685 RepID=A0ABV2G8Q4_9BACL